MPTANEKQLVALGRVLQTLREEENADVLIETTLNYLQTEFEYNLIWLGLYDRLDHRLIGKGGVTPTGDTTLLKTKFFLNPGDLLEQVVIQQRPVGVPDLREEVRAGEWRRAAQQFSIQGTLLFPLRCKDRCYGVALLGSYQWGVSPSAGEKAHLSLLCGGLASALYQIEVDWQRSSTKRPDQALFQVLEQIAKATTMQQSLEAIVATTQQFVTPTRTNLYWFEPQGRYFWLRVGNQQKARAYSNSLAGSSGLLVQELNEFYLALGTGQIVAIGAGRSPLKAEVTGRLMQRLRARSMLAAPIIVRRELVGFLAVEGNEPRIWEEAEKNYVRSVAGLLAIVAEGESATKAHQQSVANSQLVAKVANAVGNSADSQVVVQQSAALLLEQLGVERFLLLKEETGDLGASNDSNTDSGAPLASLALQLVYQHIAVPNRRPISTPLPALTLEDLHSLLAHNAETQDVASFSSSVIAIEDWEEDKRLLAWKSTFMQVGVRSLLICRIGVSPPLEAKAEQSRSIDANNLQTTGLLVLCHGTPRTWNEREQELVAAFGQQIFLMWQMKSLVSLVQLKSSSQQSLQLGLKTLLSFTEDPDTFERAFIAFLAELLACPLAALVRWTPEKLRAEVASSVVTSPSFALPLDLAIYPNQDPLIQEALSTESLLERRTKELSSTTREWLARTGTGCLLVMALPNSTNQMKVLNFEKQQEILSGAKSIVLLADQPQRQWPSHLLPVVETLVRQFAICSYYLRSYDVLERQVTDLQQLNWYKHKCLETFHNAVAASISALVELPKDEVPTKKEGTARSLNSSHEHPNLSPLQQPSTPETLRRMRSSQLLHQMENTLAALAPLLSQEQWHTTLKITQIPLANLLKRSLLLLTPLTKQRQLAATVHIPSTEAVLADRLKLECVLLELLLSAIRNIKSGGTLNIWCRPIASQELEIINQQESSKLSSSTPSSSLLEVLITDKIAPGKMDAGSDRIKEEPIHLSQIPNSLNLKICQQVVRSLGGDLQFYQMEGGYYISRLLLVRAS